MSGRSYCADVPEASSPPESMPLASLSTLAIHC